MSIYMEQHYEDVAKILSKDARTVEIVTEDIARDFADLFAADDPLTCLHCGQEAIELGDTCPVGGGIGAPHAHTQGFNREQFLEACGLDPKQEKPRNLGFHQ
ncbi:hypothetical protein LCGC14_1011010 [marine sediment metagenome]|uniref:Uncharacterized protein n=1 Tax=marine sediment metagenome TaxID=412755 RepID=A0A0F9N4R9_9ZZZZ